MKRVVVTGAQGGTGGSLVRVLRDHGWDVTGVDLAMPGPTDSGYKRADVLDGVALNDLFAGAYGVVHFGSVPTDNFTSWTECFRNVMQGGFNVLPGVPFNLRIEAVNILRNRTVATSVLTIGSGPIGCQSGANRIQSGNNFN